MKLKIKFYQFLILLCLPIIANADTLFPTTTDTEFNGFYLGPELGYSTNKIHYENSVNISGYEYNAERSYFADGAQGGLEVGVGNSLNSLYFGIVLDALTSNSSSNETFSGGGSTETLNFKEKSTGAVSLLLGTPITSFYLIYAGVGIAASKWEATEYNSPNPHLEDSTKRWLTGTQLRLGQRILLSRHWQLGTNLVFTQYKKFSQIVTISSGTPQTEQYQPAQFAGMVDISYLF